MADAKPKSSAAIVIAVIAAVLAVVAGLLWLCGCLGGGTRGGKSGGRVATILAVNDIYRIDGVGENEIGGLHRLRTLRKTIEKEAGKVLLLHAGDFLSPSLESRVFKGEQMIDAMNNLDGDPKKFDARMFVTFGNHEFDDSDCNKPPAPLNARINESQFTWLNANLDFSNCASMKDVMVHKNVKRTAIVEIGGIKFGLFGIGLTPDPKNMRKYPGFGELYESARGAIKELRAKKANVIVALTHLNREDDQYLIDALSGSGLDLVIGGHDHSWMVLKDNGGTARGYKADSDAKSAWRITVRLPAKGGATFDGERVMLDGTVTPDKALDALAKDWSAQAEARFCAERKKEEREPNGHKCLQDEAGTAQFAVRLEEEDNRNTETEFGRWIARVVRDTTNADVAIVHAGILGLNTNLKSGAKLRVGQIVDIFRYDDPVAVRSVRASVICAAIRHGLGRPGTGAWPHLYGVRAEGVPKTPEEAQTQKNKWSGAIKFEKADIDCTKDTLVKVAAAPYLLCGGDDYPVMVADDEKGASCMDTLKSKPILDATSTPPAQPISAMAEKAIAAAGKLLVLPP